jgi:precorrin-4 methylase
MSLDWSTYYTIWFKLGYGPYPLDCMIDFGEDLMQGCDYADALIRNKLITQFTVKSHYHATSTSYINYINDKYKVEIKNGKLAQYIMGGI